MFIIFNIDFIFIINMFYFISQARFDLSTFRNPLVPAATAPEAHPALLCTIGTVIAKLRPNQGCS
jgi:hypothetical protein